MLLTAIDAILFSRASSFRVLANQILNLLEYSVEQPEDFSAAAISKKVVSEIEASLSGWQACDRRWMA